MKKISIYALGMLVGASLVACDNYTEPNPPAQSNPAPSVLQLRDVEVSEVVNAETTVDLNELNASGQKMTIATVKVENMPMGYDLGAVGELSVNGFSTTYELPMSVVASEVEGLYDVLVSPDDLDGVYKENITLNPAQKLVDLRFLLVGVRGSQVAYIGGNNNYYSCQVNIVPFPNEMEIETAYYLVGTIDNWEVAGAIKFNHSSKDQYEDPVFTVTFDVTEDQAKEGWWWKVIPQSTYATGNWSDADYSQFGVATNGDTAASGTLKAKKDGQDPGAGMFTESGKWILTINMLEMTYEFSPAPSYLYTPGNSNSWNQLNSQWLTSTDGEVFTGYAYLDGEFKFSSQPNWDGVNYGATDAEGELSTDGGAGNLNAEKAGLYWCEVNITALTYKLTYIETIGVIGDSTPGGWDNSTPLTPSENFLTWTGEIKFGSGEFKFRANNGWDVNLGGSLENLTQGGENMPSPGDGTYKVTLDLSQLPYSAQTVAK